MATYFFDASAVVKRYVHEPGSEWVRQLCNARGEHGNRLNPIAIAEISRVEVAAAFAVLARRNEITANLAKRVYKQFTDELDQEYRSIRFTAEIIRNASDLTQQHPLKAYDAVQLAAALAFLDSLKNTDVIPLFISGDDKLLQAAQAEGLATDNPFDHAALN